MRFLIAGSPGFLSSHLCEYRTERGYQNGGDIQSDHWTGMESYSLKNNDTVPFIKGDFSEVNELAVDPLSPCADINGAHRLLNREPRTPLEKGLRRTIDHFELVSGRPFGNDGRQQREVV